MKFAIVCLFAFVAAAWAESKYTDKYDSINVQEVLDNDRLFEAYLACILDLGPCTPEGKELKSHIQDALETGCAKCTETQQSGTKTVIKHMIHKKKDAWKKVTHKFDPTGKYAAKYENEYKDIMN